jgi:hypothetical protein
MEVGMRKTKRMAAAWWAACASLALAQDLLQEPASPGRAPGLPLCLLALVYLLLFLIARTYLIACPSRALARAQLEGLWAEHVQGWEEGQKQEDDQKKRDAREDTEECLRKARDLLEGRGFWGQIWTRLSLLLWNGEREMAAWALMHRAERRAVELMKDEEVRARLVRGLGELGVFSEEERALWRKQLKRALGLEGQDPQQGSPSQGGGSGQEVAARALSPSTDPQEPGQGSGQAESNARCCQKPDSRVQRALLKEFLAALYDVRDTRYAQLLTLHNKAAWLLLVGLGLAVALGSFTPGLPNGLDLGTGLLLGFLGGVLSRLLRVVATKELPTDYGAYWVPLFLAPVLGALGAVGGYLVFWALVEAQALGEGLKPLLSPPAAYGLLVVLGFSERLLKGLTERLEDQALKQEDQGKEKPKGDGKEGQGKPQDQSAKR